MRDAYHGQLAKLSAELGLMCDLSTTALARATQALISQNLELSEQVITDDADLEAAYADFERAASMVLARWALVGRELRAVVGMIQVGKKIRRMGGLARHIAEAARRRHPQAVLPPSMEARFAEMGQLGVTIGRQVRAAIAAPTVVEIEQIERLDDRVDQLESSALTWASTEQQDVRAGVDVALLARFFERFADQGVSAARSLQFIATGEPSRHSDALA
jgi:phosphate transport system protein